MAIKAQHLLTCGAVMLPIALAGCVVPADRYYYDRDNHAEYDHWQDAPHDRDYNPQPTYYREHYDEYDR